MTRAARPHARAPWIAAGAIVSIAAAGILAWTLDYVPGLPSPQRARADAELARQRAASEETQRHAQATADKDRAAKSRAQAEAEIARARAEVEATRRKASVELAAAQEARRAAEAALKSKPAPGAKSLPVPLKTSTVTASQSLAPPPRVAAAPAPLATKTAAPQSYDGAWQAEFKCRSYLARPAFSSTVQVSVSGSEFNIEHGEAGKAGSFQVSGSARDGHLHLTGRGLAATSKRPQPYAATFDGRYDAGRFEGTGSLGAQPCAFSVTRAN